MSDVGEFLELRLSRCSDLSGISRETLVVVTTGVLLLILDSQRTSITRVAAPSNDFF